MPCRRLVKFPRLLLALAVCVAFGACNPSNSNPRAESNELDTTAALYTGPPAAWLEIAVTGARADAVFALALVRTENLAGPAERSCAGEGGAVVDCVNTTLDVRMPNQRVIPGDGSTSERLMTLWSGERVEVVLVCVDPTTQELGCPDTVRVSLRTVDTQGALIGELLPS